MRAAVYTRVSTDEQGASLDAQEAGARAWCEKHGATVVAVYRDEGISGAEWVHRPGLRSMLDEVTATPRPWDVLVVRDLDRLGRDALRLGLAVETLHDHGARCVAWSTGEEVHADPMARAVLVLRGVLAEQERAQIAHRVRVSLKQKAEKGLVTGGVVYGWRNERSPDGVRYVIDEGEAAVVRELYERHAAGDSARALAQRLNARGIPSPRSESGGTGSWCSQTVLAILRSERYRGAATWGRLGARYKGGSRVVEVREDVVRYEVPAIVEAELWHRAQARSETVRATTGRPSAKRAPRYLLVGHAVCDHCGGPLAGWRSTSGSGDRRRPHLVYRCLWHSDRGNAVCSAAYARPQAPIDRAILGQLGAMLAPELVREAVETARERLRAREGNEARELAEAAEREAAQRVGRLTAALEHGAGDVASVVERLRAASTDLDRARAVLAAMAAPAPVLDADVERALIARAADVRGAIATAYDLAAEGDAEAMTRCRGLLGSVLAAPLRARFEGGELRVAGHAAPGSLLGLSEGAGGTWGMAATPIGFGHTPCWPRGPLGALAA